MAMKFQEYIHDHEFIMKFYMSINFNLSCMVIQPNRDHPAVLYAYFSALYYLFIYLLMDKTMYTH